MTDQSRQSTGIPALDELLGGGLIPGTLTVVVGATGMGKTQLGIQYAHAGLEAEQGTGVVFDMCARGDSQSHNQYAERLFDWTLKSPGYQANDRSDLYNLAVSAGDYLHVFDQQGRRVTRQDLDWDQWHDWQAQLNRKLLSAITFLYGNLVRGCRRVVVDGVEPVGRPNESVQLNLFEYVYHQVLRKDPEWVARDLFRQDYRAHAEQAAGHVYDPDSVGCMMLYTSHESMLDDLIRRPLDEGDTLSNANTVIYMGRVRQQERVSRALYVAKHRGSSCTDRIVPFEINDQGIQIIDENR